MSLDLRNFVQVNIKYNASIVSVSERGVVTLITKNPKYAESAFGDEVFHSLAKYEQYVEENELAKDLDVFAQAFFQNKGKALQIVSGYQSGQDVSAYIRSKLAKLDYKHVIIVSDAEEDDFRKAALSSADRVAIAVDPSQNPPISPSSVDAFAGLNEKIFISSISDPAGLLFDKVPLENAPTYQANLYYSYDAETGLYELLTGPSQPADWPGNANTGVRYYAEAEIPDLDNYCIKVGKKGIEMFAAAYLSKVKTNDPATIQDYGFTVETMGEFKASAVADNDQGVNLINKHFNFDTYLVNEFRNYPGDTITGKDFMNYYVKILIVQDLSESIMNLLASKIRFNQTGVNRLINAISQTMNTYISNGYLDTEYIWTDEDLYYSFNGQEYLVCSRNTPLVKGYKCVILPLTSLTPEQRDAHALPPVYILMADQTGARVVMISGDVF